MSEILNSPWLLPICVFVAVSLAAWSVADIFSAKANKSGERLRRIQGLSSQAHSNVLKQKESDPALSQWVQKTSEMMAGSIVPQNKKEADALKRKLDHAGLRADNAQVIFLAIKMLLLGLGTVVGLFGVAFFTDRSGISWALGGSVGLLMFFIPSFFLSQIIASRQQKIVLSIPDALDLLVVCVEAGLGLDNALRKVSEEMGESDPILAHEISVTNMHLQMGRSREEALQDLSDRNGADELTSLTQMLIQADRFGTSIATALRVQSDALRVRRRQRAEEKASKTAVQLLFPLVLFIFPGIFVVLVGPAAINIIDNMLT